MISANAISLQTPPVGVPAQPRPASGGGNEANGADSAASGGQAQSTQASPPSSGSPFRGVNLDISV